MNPIQILSGAPLWVWPVLVLLIFLGVRASKMRTLSVIPLYLFPLVGILSFNAVSALGAGGSVWAIFGLAYLTGTWAGKRYQTGLILEKSGKRVKLAGEWVTLTVLMIVFWSNFAGGIVRAILPDVFTSTGFHLVFAAIAGLAAGSFMGRAIGVFTKTETAETENTQNP